MPFWSDPTIKPKQAFRWVISFGDRDYSSTTSTESNAVLSFAAKSVTKPSYTIKSNKYKLLGSHAFNYPTSLEWQPITIKFVDIWGFNTLDEIKFAKEPIITDKKTGIVFPRKDSLQEFNFKNKEYVQGNEKVDTARSIQQFFYSYLSDAGYVAPYEGERPDKLQRYRKSIYKQNSIAAMTSGQNIISISELSDSGFPIETWELNNPFISKVSFGDLSYESENLVEITVEIQYDWAELKPYTEKDYSNLEKSIIKPLSRAKTYQDEEIKLTRDNIKFEYDEAGRQKFRKETGVMTVYDEVSVGIESLKKQIKREDNKVKEETVVKNILASTRAYTELESKPRQGKLSQELSKYYKGTGPLSAIIKPK